MSIASVVIVALLIDSSIALSLFTRNSDFENSLQEPTSADTVPNINFNFGCKCTLKGSPTSPKPEEPTTPVQPMPQLPLQSTPANPTNPALPSASGGVQPNLPTSKQVFPTPQLPHAGRIPKPIPFNPEAGPQLPSILPNLPNPNLPKPNPQQPEVSPATPNGDVKPQPFLPNQPFQPFQPFPETTRPGQQSIPNIEKLGSLLESLTGLDCKCNGDVAPQQNMFPSGFPFGFGNN